MPGYSWINNRKNDESDLNTLSALMQSPFKVTETWCIQQEQKINADKTQLIVFTKNKNVQGFKAPMIFGKEIHLSETVKILRITQDRNLNFNIHVQNTIQKAKSTLWMYRRNFSPPTDKSTATSFTKYNKCDENDAKFSHLCNAQYRTAIDTFIESLARATCLRLQQVSLLTYMSYGHGQSKLWSRMFSQSPDLEMPSILSTFLTTLSKHYFHPERNVYQTQSFLAKTA